MIAGLPPRCRQYKVEVAVAGGRGALDAVRFAEVLDSAGVRLDVAGVPLALMAAAVTVVVVVEAADPVTALITGADAVARAAGDGMEVKSARVDAVLPAVSTAVGG